MDKKTSKEIHLKEYYEALDKIDKVQTKDKVIGKTNDSTIYRDGQGKLYQERGGIIFDYDNFVDKTKSEYYNKGRGSDIRYSYQYSKVRKVEEYKLDKLYELNFEKEAMIKILLCMEKFNVEFGGFLIGTVDNEKDVITIEEIFLPKQSVSGAECVFDNDDEAFIINKHQEKYLGILHSHVTMGAFYSAQDESVISDALKLKGTNFLSVVISESKTLIDRITTKQMNESDNLLNKMLETEFIGNVFVRTLEDKYIRHEINRITVDNVNITDDKLESLKKEVDRFYDEVKDIKIDVMSPLLETDEELETFIDGELWDLIYSFSDLTEKLYKETSLEIDIIDLFVKVASDKQACSDAIDFFSSAEDLRENFIGYHFL